MQARFKLILINAADAVLLNCAVLAALALRFDFAIPERFLRSYSGSAFFYTAGMLLLLNLAGINRSLWRYAGVPTLLVLVRTLGLGFSLAFILNLVPQVHLFPSSVVILTWILSTVLIGGSRLAWRVVRTPRWRAARRGGSRILIVGAGEVGAMLCRELLRAEHPAGTPIGFVDDDPQLRGRRIETLAVLGSTFDLPRLISEKRIGQVLIAAPSAPAHLVRQVVHFCQEAGVECRTVPALSDVIAGKGALGQVSEVRIEDLQGRDPVQIDVEGIAGRVRDRTVLVTGAGGSIGSELCRQLALFQPARLVALDHCENRLCYLGLDLGERHPELQLTQVVGDIRDESGMRELMADYRPQLVFHAAAHKHVHFLERTPREALLNNILGTRNTARAAAAAGVETFVFISTDKAVNPSNVMGASKRACEIVLQAMASEATTTFVAVRFGNVLGSDGSVIPIFRRQMERGGPLTVTHPEVRRYFMTIPEASRLVIQAAVFGSSGDVFVLDMGEQVRILDFAEQLIRLSGLRPGIDIAIKFIGLRPGEKLEEELLTDDERTRVTQHRKIFRVELDPVDPAEVMRRVDLLAEMAVRADRTEIVHALGELVPEYVVRDPEPLPIEAPVFVAERRGPRVAPPRRETTARRLLEIGTAGVILALLSPLAGVLFLHYRLSGPGLVRFVREERIGQNRRTSDRRRDGSAVPIDRRDTDRRQRPLPGKPFVSYHVELVRGRQSRMQRWLSRLLLRYRLDRVLLLWSVVRGEMGLVGPSARLIGEASYRQDWASAWVFARRPGLVGPGDLLAVDGADRSRHELYDGYYARYGGARLDLETLWLSLFRLFRGADPLPDLLDQAAEPAEGMPASGQKG